MPFIFPTTELFDEEETERFMPHPLRERFARMMEEDLTQDGTVGQPVDTTYLMTIIDRMF